MFENYEIKSATDDNASIASTNVNPIVNTYSVPWVTWLIIIVCAVIFVGLAIENNYKSWDTLKRWGCIPGESIWRGDYWGLFSSAFVHFAFWHLAFNMYWLWVLGRQLEKTIGSFRYLFFVLASAFVSSSYQLAVSDSTGIGMSGVGYSIIGYMWASRHCYPQFKTVLTPQIIKIFIVWLIGCFIISYLKIFQIGNAAHLSGLLFGLFISWCFVLRYKPFFIVPVFSIFVIVGIIPVFWCPWSNTWLGAQAYKADIEQNYQEAIGLYSRIIKRDPKNAWAYHNRGKIYEHLGDSKKSQEDLEKAHYFDPQFGDSK